MGKKIIHIILLLILCFTIFASCKTKQGHDQNLYTVAELDYNTTKIFEYSRYGLETEDVGCRSRFKQEFLETTLTKGMKNNEGTLSQYRGFIIQDEVQSDSIFYELPKLNYETEMLVVIMFSLYETRDGYAIQKIERSDNVLKITMDEIEYIHKEDKNKTSQSYVPPRYIQHIQGYVMDKLDVATLEMKFCYKEFEI